jgi:hypothetical protein
MAEERRPGIGYSFVENLDAEIEQTLTLARTRLPVEWGRSPGYDPLNIRVLLDGMSAEMVDTRRTSPQDIMTTALTLREIVEWNGWSRDTAFPDVRALAAPGEPLGQCLVTARFAKDYFLDARLAEVRVRHRGGKIVGPHVILTVPSEEYGEMALDLTPDQALAVGEIPTAVKQINPHFKINLIPLADPRSPYEVIRYQEDDELATKRSKPLEHTRLLKEKVIFALGHESANRLEKYAERTPHFRDLPADLQLAFMDELASVDLQGAGLDVEAGVVAHQELQPNPFWLWDAAGLHGYKTAIIYNKGFIQEVLALHQGQINILNLVGQEPSVELLDRLGASMDTSKTRVLVGRPLLHEHIENRGWTGPIFVQR